MQLSDFDYKLPDDLIARYPGESRSGSRLLCLDRRSGEVSHRVFRDILNLIEPGDLLVFNDTRVLPARLFGRKATGGRVEVLIERVLSDREALAQVRASKSPKAGMVLELGRAWPDSTTDAKGLSGQKSTASLKSALNKNNAAGQANAADQPVATSPETSTSPEPNAATADT